MDSKRWDLRGEKNNPFTGIESIRFSAVRTDYHHDEKKEMKSVPHLKTKAMN